MTRQASQLAVHLAQVVIIVQVVLVGLRIGGAIAWPWEWICAPIWLAAVGGVAVWILYLLPPRWRG